MKVYTDQTIDLYKFKPRKNYTEDHKETYGSDLEVKNDSDESREDKFEKEKPQLLEVAEIFLK